MGEKMAEEFCLKMPNFHVTFTCRKSTTWDRRLYFPSEGRCAEDFFAMKNPTASVGFETANLGTKGQHAAHDVSGVVFIPTVHVTNFKVNFCQLVA